MGKHINLIGEKFGRLSPIKYIGNSKWLCECDCGNEVVVLTACLRNGNTKSCGCYNREKVIENSYKHGQSKSRINHIYRDMKDRCYNSKKQNYKYYGGRGIIICDEWLDKKEGFLDFYNWSLENGYNDKLSIDRKNVNGNYTPDNCRWVTFDDQMKNMRSNHYIEINGEIKTVKEWSIIFNINYGTLLSRINKLHWDLKDIFKDVRKLNKKEGY
jgi:hypothetical protein